MECDFSMPLTSPDNFNDFGLLSQMAKSIADEIRNPLTGIAGSVSMLKEEININSDKLELKVIDDCIAKIDGFIEDLYLLSRPINPCFIKVDIGPFIEQVVDYYLRDKKSKCQFGHLESGLQVSADIVLLQQIITTVLENAIDATKRKGNILISVEKNIKQKKFPEMASIIIQDTGMGMETKILKKLFTPFFTTKHKGRGLGLIIARNYVNFHQGMISIDSQKSIGTKVVIDLPICRGGVDGAERKYSGR